MKSPHANFKSLNDVDTQASPVKKKSLSINKIV